MFVLFPIKHAHMNVNLLIIKAALLGGLVLISHWEPDAAGAKVLFSVKGPFGTVHGNFSGLKANIQFSEKDPSASSISASIDANTISTGIGKRNKDLKKEKWLQTDKYPRISFRSRKIEQAANGGYKALGDLTLKGITRSIELPFTFTPSGDSGVFKGQFVIHRSDFHVGKDGGSVGNDITITLEVPVKK
jgi:polyisoprenoid-binding protein YceI